jgi:hypothetical protein
VQPAGGAKVCASEPAWQFLFFREFFKSAIALSRHSSFIDAVFSGIFGDPQQVSNNFRIIFHRIVRLSLLVVGQICKAFSCLLLFNAN